MQVAKGPYKCVPRQLRMTCEPRPSANTPRFFCRAHSKPDPHGTSPARRRDTSGGMPTGQPQDASKATERGIPQGGANYGLTAYQRPLAGSAC